MTATQILGWLTLVSQVAIAGYVTVYLTHAGRESRTWLRRMRVPKPARGELVLSSGSDYVGVV